MNDDLKQALRDRFDAGDDLTPKLRDAIAASPDAAAYWRRLQALDASLWHLPLETPPPDLVTRLQREVARDRQTRTARRAAFLAALALVALAAYAGWKYPDYASPNAWWYRAAQYLPELSWLKAPQPIQTHLTAVWTEFARAFDYAPAYPMTITLSALAAAVLILVIFNAAGARTLRIAGNAGTRRVSHHI